MHKRLSKVEIIIARSPIQQVLNRHKKHASVGDPFENYHEGEEPMTVSIVRRNLMERPGYTPYCGAIECSAGMPRSVFDGQQFKCCCGWRSNFEAEFIEQYKQRQTNDATASTSR